MGTAYSSRYRSWWACFFKWMTRTPSFRIASLLLALLPLGAQGQDADRAGVVAALETGQRVRLEVEGLGRVEGRFLTADEAAITFVAGEPIRLPDINRLWVRGRHTKRGAWIGALVGVAFGIWIGTVAANACDIDGEPCFTTAQAAAVGGLFSGAGGAFVGAGIGFAIPTWRLRFP